MIKILHVSDVHFGVNDPKGEQVLITDALIKAVERDSLDPDVIVFSGDLAHAGTLKQFKIGEDWLRRLCDAAPRADLFIVPGNHDVQRAKVQGPNLLHSSGSKEQSYYEWKRSLHDQNPVHLEEFFSWVKGAGSVLPLKGSWITPYGFHYTKEGLERPLHIIGLNSALLSCSDSDEKNLAIDVLAATEGLHRSQPKPGVVVAVAHHPFEHLVDWNRKELEKFLQQGTGADIYLHGHLHAQLGVAKYDITGKGLATLAAGAAYQGSNWPQQFASYTIGERDMQTVVYTYSADSGKWIVDNKLSGTLMLDLPPLDGLGGAAQPPGGVQIERLTIETRTTEPGRREEGQADSAHVTVKLIKYEVLRYSNAARYVEQQVAKFFQEDPELAKICYAVKHRVKDSERIKEKMQQKGIHTADKIVDICGFRLITFYQGDIPIIVEQILKAIEFEDHPKSPFKKGSSVELEINTSRTESDPLSIIGAVQSVAARSSLVPEKPRIRSRQTGYSSVHLIVSAPVKGGDDVDEMFVEIQIRSAWEDIWGEIDHRLRYGLERGGMGVSSSQHLNVFKVLIDGVAQYVDVIRRQSEQSNTKSPSAIKVDRTIASPDNQLARLRGLKPEILDRVSKAYDLWRQADASRQRGGDPGLLRQAADAFAALLLEFKGQPADDVKLADELEYVACTERAYLLMYTGDNYDLAQSAELYENILGKRPSDATALFRLGTVRGRQRQFKESERLLTKALEVIESGNDDRLDVHHWTYDIVRLGLGLTCWRIFKSAGSRQHLNSAIKRARSVIAEPVQPVDSTNVTRAVNDLLYYACEEREYPVEGQDRLVTDSEFKELMEKLEKELALQERSYEYQDTLMTALMRAERQEDARAVALKLRDMLEQVAVLKSPGANLGKKETYAWVAALSKVLDDPDQQECLVHAQDVIASRQM